MENYLHFSLEITSNEILCIKIFIIKQIKLQNQIN